MAKPLRVALALFLSGTALTTTLPTIATAATGYPVMLQGLQGPDAGAKFADIIIESVNKKADGTAPLRGGTGWYNPKAVYEMFRVLHPQLGFTKTNPSKADFIALADYIRTLELVELDKPGVYVNTRMIRRGNTYRHDLRWRHFLPKGTKVLADRNTGRPILKANCANGIAPVDVPPKQCIYVLVPAGRMLKLSKEVLSRSYVNTQECEVSIAGPGSGTGGMNFEPEDFVVFAEREPFPCEWRSAVSYFETPTTGIKGCIKVDEGWWAIKLDPSFLNDPTNILLICEQLVDGSTSLSVDIRPRDFRKTASGLWIAVVWPSEQQVPPAYRTDGQWIEWDTSRFSELEARYSFRRQSPGLIFH